MLPWHLSLAMAMPPASRAAAVARVARRQRAAIAAALAAAVTLALGWAGGPPAPGIAAIAIALGLPQVAALAAAAGAGLLAWQLARLTVDPLADMPTAGLMAALTVLLTMPHLGLGALIVPVVLSLAAMRPPRRKRVVALLVHCGAALAIAAALVNQIGLLFPAGILLGFPLVEWIARPSQTANDNPSMKRIG